MVVALDVRVPGDLFGQGAGGDEPAVVEDRLAADAAVGDGHLGHRRFDRADEAPAERQLPVARSAAERVEIACGGGRGRTGTALACLAVLDGVPPREAVAYVREHYHRRAVETPWQRRYVQRF
ncbi:protein phosphatase [Streptomyces sviceus]|uniref:phosphatase domain-containing protein n=1 Tax=Streptomyces sviceus TaxID=285530 RepID=UPI003CC8C59A